MKTCAPFAKKKWAQAKQAEITGLSVNEIGGLERKKIVPSLGVLMALSTAWASRYHA